MTKLVIALVAAVAVALTAPGVVSASSANAAELKYTLHMEAKPAANAANDPMSAMAGGMISQMFPAGGLDQTVIAGDKGARFEQKQDMGAIKAGSVMLVKPDGVTYVLDPSTKTYWKMPAIPAEMAGMMASMKPKVTLGGPGVFETIGGMKCEHLTVTMAIGIPGIDPSQLPPGMPSELPMVYDVWLTDAFKMPPAAGAMSMGVVKQFGLDQIPELKKLSGDGRMVVKAVMSMFGVEIVMESKDIKTEAAAPELFEIPKDYKEVPPPGGGGQTIALTR